MSEKFRTIFDHVEIFCEPGNPIYKEYAMVNVSEDPAIEIFELKEVGEYSFYDQIQAYKDSTDLHKILERYAQTGDESIINRRPGFFADITDMPNTYADYLRMAASAQILLDSLPQSAREAFNNDPDEFIKSIGTDKFKSYFDNLESEVNVNEQEQSK